MFLCSQWLILLVVPISSLPIFGSPSSSASMSMSMTRTAIEPSLSALGLDEVMSKLTIGPIDRGGNEGSRKSIDFHCIQGFTHDSN